PANASTAGPGRVTSWCTRSDRAPEAGRCRSLTATKEGIMAKLDFAYWDSMGYAGDNAGVADIYDEHIRTAQRIEELGWGSYFVIEHQNAGRISAPSVYLTAVARATDRLRVGAMIWQLPFYHPLRLAEEV